MSQTTVLNLSIEPPDVLGPDLPIRLEEALSDFKFQLSQGLKTCESSATVEDQPRYQLAFNKTTRPGGFSQNLSPRVTAWPTKD